MKPVTYFSFFLFIGLFFFSFSAEAIDGKIIKSNWPGMETRTYTYMRSIQLNGYFSNDPIGWNPCYGCPGNGTMELPITETYVCINQDADDNIEIGLYYAISDLNYQQYAPSIRLRYTVAGQVGEIAHHNMDYAGQSGNYHNFSKTITISLSSLSIFNYKFEVITANGAAYPANNYPNLFKEYNNDFTSPTVEEGRKSICDGYNIFGLNPLSQQDNEIKESITLKTQTTDSEVSEIIKAYPNPFTHHFNIESNKDDNSMIKIFNMQGKLVYREEKITFVKDSPKRIDASNFAAGMYYCQIQTSTGSRTIQLIKNK